MQQTMREKRFFLWFSWAAAALAVVVAVFAIFEDRNYPYAAAMLGLAVILVFLREGFPRIFSRKLAKNSMKQMQEAYGQPETQESFFYEDSLRLYTPNTKGELRYGYQAVAVCMETETLLLLQTQQKQLVILPKSGFSGIDSEGFKTFMREKAPNARFRW